ncbi:hypothetical protein VXQ18_01795 [Brucella abortus]|nr:hypothetical protein [Brucella abortus]
MRLMGFDAVMEQPFTAEFSQRSAEDFVQHILLKSCVRAASSPVMTFISARGRRGTPEFLCEAGEKGRVQCYAGRCLHR